MFKPTSFCTKLSQKCLKENLTICDPCDPGNGVKITTAPGMWTITHNAGDILKRRTPSCEAHLTGLTSVDMSLDKNLPIRTNTGILALVKDGFDWDASKTGMSEAHDPVFGGENYLAFNMRATGEFRLQLRFDCAGWLIDLRCS